MRVVYHDVCVFVLWEVSHIMVKHTSLGNIKRWPLWDVDDKLIYILAVVGHKVIILELPFFTLLLIGSVCGTYCVEVWKNTSPVDGGSPHYSLGAPIMRLQK